MRQSGAEPESPAVVRSSPAAPAAQAGALQLATCFPAAAQTEAKGERPGARWPSPLALHRLLGQALSSTRTLLSPSRRPHLGPVVFQWRKLESRFPFAGG